MTTFFDPTGKQSTNMQFYFGPNHFKTLLNSNDLSLSQKDLELEDLVYLGWPIIRWVNRWFTINLFDWLSGWGLSMGVVLLLMTIIVKVLVYPATYKSYMSSAKMRVLKPYINEINAKYPKKEDALKKQQETMALYSKYGVSPHGRLLAYADTNAGIHGFIFFVPNAIELRQQSFLWAPDLSTYDDIINWGTNIPLLGNHLSLFCLLFSITNILNTNVHHETAGYGTTANAGYETNDVYHASHVYFHLQRLFFRFELLLLHFRTDWYPHYGDSAQNN